MNKPTVSEIKKAAGTLPACGREKLVEFNSKHYWLTHEASGFRIRETAWQLENGLAVLKG